MQYIRQDIIAHRTSSLTPNVQEHVCGLFDDSVTVNG